MNRQLLVRTAQGYYEAAKELNTDGEIYSSSEKICCMENALNHTENKLFVAIELLKEVLSWECQDDDNELDQKLKEQIKKLVEVEND